MKIFAILELGLALAYYLEFGDNEEKRIARIILAGLILFLCAIGLLIYLCSS